MKTVNVSIEGASPLSPRARKTRQSQERQGMARRGQEGHGMELLASALPKGGSTWLNN